MVEMPISSLRGKWAQGIQPRDFTWIIKGQLAVCERLGGRGANHRAIRRQEEIVWILNERIDLTISMIPEGLNLEAYEKYGLSHRHWPVPDNCDPLVQFLPIYEQMGIALDHRKSMLIHRFLLGDLMMGFIGGYLIWAGYLKSATEAVVLVQRLFSATLGEEARDIITTIAESDERKETPPVVW